MASARGIDWKKWECRWALKSWGQKRSPRKYSWRIRGLRAEPRSIGGASTAFTGEEDNQASLVFLESKCRNSSKQCNHDAGRCVK